MVIESTSAFFTGGAVYIGDNVRAIVNRVYIRQSTSIAGNGGGGVFLSMLGSYVALSMPRSDSLARLTGWPRGMCVLWGTMQAIHHHGSARGGWCGKLWPWRGPVDERYRCRWANPARVDLRSCHAMPLHSEWRGHRAQLRAIHAHGGLHRHGLLRQQGRRRWHVGCGSLCTCAHARYHHWLLSPHVRCRRVVLRCWTVHVHKPQRDQQWQRTSTRRRHCRVWWHDVRHCELYAAPWCTASPLPVANACHCHACACVSPPQLPSKGTKHAPAARCLSLLATWS